MSSYPTLKSSNNPITRNLDDGATTSKMWVRNRLWNFLTHHCFSMVSPRHPASAPLLNNTQVIAGSYEMADGTRYDLMFCWPNQMSDDGAQTLVGKGISTVCSD